MNKCKNCLIDIPNKRKFCGSRCSALYNNKLRIITRKPPTCLSCGNIIHNFNSQYNRKYCTNKCMGKYVVKTKSDKITNIIETALEAADYNVIGSKLTIDRRSKRYLISKYGNKCMKCGWNTINTWTNIIPIELNHIDGNPENHMINNLELLCPNCHSLTQFNKSRGKGRKWRR